MSRFMGDNLTPAQMKARNTLALLSSEEGTSSALSVCVSLMAEGREKSFADKYGLSQASGIVCLARLFGKRCCPHDHGKTVLPHIPPYEEHSSFGHEMGSRQFMCFSHTCVSGLQMSWNI